VSKHSRRPRRRQARASKSPPKRRQRRSAKPVALSAVRLEVRSPTLGEPVLGQRRWRTVRSGRKEGRPPTDPALIRELQAKLEAWLQEKKSRGQEPPKQDPECLEFVEDQLRSFGGTMGRTTNLRRVVQPVHQKLVHRNRWR
jgi:hypothetical protein